MKFELVAKAFDEIEKTSKRVDMTTQLAALFEQTPAEDMKNVIYLLQGRLAPAYENTETGLGEKLVIQAIARATGYTKEDVEKKFKKTGDLGQVASEYLEKKTQQSLIRTTLSVKKVHENFLKLATLTGEGTQELKIKLLAELLNSSTPNEGKFVVRFALGALRLGVGDPTLMDALAHVHLNEFQKENTALVKEIDESTGKKSPEEKIRKIRMKLREQIEAKYNIYSDLGTLAQKLTEKGLKGLNNIDLEPGVPIRPTLAERLPLAKDIIEKLGKCIVESKYDGFRLQVHKKGKDVWIFSRNLENMSDMFPEIVDAAKKQLDCHTCIVEGEALAVNEETQEFFPFQITIQRKRKYDIDEKAKELPLKLFLFDVMSINDKNLMPLPFHERREKLKKLIMKGETIELTNGIITDSSREVDKFFNENVSGGLEGIVCKDLNAPYIAGARKFAWIKLKRSYKGELQDTVDLVIIGFYKGKGKRTEFGLGGLLAAVYDDKADLFKSITRIGTGFSEEMLADLHKLLSKHTLNHKPARVDSDVTPYAWVEPKFVIEVRADEITQSPMHTAGREQGESTGYALRFPRILKRRNDKEPEMATTVREIIKMYQNQKKVKVEEAR
ncbi:MAG: ATP-dependent DNA ligase [Candidatus Diapherotrites archaeon]|uniref:DNA ligase n=1 Tax=Candidatus Iainarchaeum sp. TaxID=3101447 RepID=A0A8T4C6X2_9ARCH|nr:ATP-dependent DNA ligase [Candidatus Diapherotrites archaeon]